jgi:hypothetical protein
MKRLRSLDWRHVREVLLSTSRDKFRDGEDCHWKITHERGIGELMKNLERVDGIKIIDWVAVLEWYQDGFPHWHIFIETEDEGKAGMIGYKVLKHHWEHGEWVTEDYIKSEEHWKNITGYFDKHGYFEKGKAYQSRLPSWALDRKDQYKIKRWVSKHEVSYDNISFPFGANIEKGDFGNEKQSCRMSSKAYKNKSQCSGMGVKKTYRQILDECGAKSRILINANSWGDSFNVDINYQEIKSWYAWEYKEHKGLTIILNDNETESFLSKLRAYKGKKEIDDIVSLKSYGESAISIQDFKLYQATHPQRDPIVNLIPRGRTR